jgi:hypothetical protein
MEIFCDLLFYMPPRRNSKGELIFPDHPEFRPNLTPAEIFKAGAFGGSYWRPIHSDITGKNYRNKHKKFSFLKNIPNSMMTLPYDEYDKTINKYGVKVGTTLRFWEDNGWITKYDPYGWIQWYSNFYNHRRCPDDQRQIDRWLGIAGKKTGRFRKWLVNLVKKSKSKKYDDYTISPKIRQTLLHWGYEIKKHDLK